MKELIEFLSKINAISFWSKLADFHGFLAMLSLILFGGAIILFFFSSKIKLAVIWLKVMLGALLVDLILLDIAGLVVYIKYRSPGGPRTILKASEDTAWLHNIVFEHKEFLAYAPPLLILSALYIVNKLTKISDQEEKIKWLKMSIIFSIIISLAFVLTVAAEAVLVTKTAPI